jgi:Zn-dependent peptidase ImmA (M78 family)
MPNFEERMAEVPVNGKVLQWARNLRNLSIDDAALLLDISADELRKYELGAKQPLISFLRRMATKYQVNFAALLMPEPLPIEQRLTDHRVRQGRSPLSIETIVAMDDVAEALEAFADVAHESKRSIPALNIGSVSLNDDPETAATQERKQFGVSMQEQQSWRSLYAARLKWRQYIEDRGVFTYMVKMQSPTELSGFSLYQNGLGAICVNDRELTDGAKIFTFFHEYGHLLLRQGGISDENNTDRVERFCNRFAASFLAPRRWLKESVADNIEFPHEFSDGEVKELARRFRISNRAMAYRLEEVGLAPAGFYGRRTAPWDLPSPTSATKPPDKGKPNRITMQLKRYGRLHSFTVLQAEKRRLLNPFEASQLVGLRPASFQKLAKAIG